MPTTTKSRDGDHATGVYQSRLPLSTATLEAIRAEIVGYRREVKSRWSKRSAGQLTDLIAAVLFHDQRPADVAAPAGISASTVRRWLHRVLDRLARRASRLGRVLRRAVRDGHEVVLFDCTLVRTTRRGGKANRPNYNGKHRCHGLLFLAVTDLCGNLLWIGQARLGRTSDLTCARQAGLVAKLREHGLAAVGDLAFTALDDDPDHHPVIVTGYKATRWQKLTPASKQANQIVAGLRAPGEHGFALLKCWRVLTKLRLNPKRATVLLRAPLVLTRIQYGR
ncbi:MAG TPA: transposase family protein [Candidatus Limnocylindrales bacterium]|nr:transposase family protein [Candidatus Limnocylindrales bacterium]